MAVLLCLLGVAYGSLFLLLGFTIFMASNPKGYTQEHLPVIMKFIIKSSGSLVAAVVIITFHKHGIFEGLYEFVLGLFDSS